MVPAGGVVLRGHRKGQLVATSGSGRRSPVPTDAYYRHPVDAAGAAGGTRPLRERGRGSGVSAAETGFVRDIRQARSCRRPAGRHAVHALGMHPRVRDHRAAGRQPPAGRPDRFGFATWRSCKRRGQHLTAHWPFEYRRD